MGSKKWTRYGLMVLTAMVFAGSITANRLHVETYNSTAVIIELYFVERLPALMFLNHKDPARLAVAFEEFDTAEGVALPRQDIGFLEELTLKKEDKFVVLRARSPGAFQHKLTYSKEQKRYRIVLTTDLHRMPDNGTNPQENKAPVSASEPSGKVGAEETGLFLLDAFVIEGNEVVFDFEGEPPPEIRQKPLPLEAEVLQIEFPKARVQPGPSLLNAREVIRCHKEDSGTICSVFLKDHGVSTRKWKISMRGKPRILETPATTSEPAKETGQKSPAGVESAEAISEIADVTIAGEEAQAPGAPERPPQATPADTGEESSPAEPISAGPGKTGETAQVMALVDSKEVPGSKEPETTLEVTPRADSEAEAQKSPSSSTERPPSPPQQTKAEEGTTSVTEERSALHPPEAGSPEVPKESQLAGIVEIENAPPPKTAKELEVIQEKNAGTEAVQSGATGERAVLMPETSKAESRDSRPPMINPKPALTSPSPPEDQQVSPTPEEPWSATLQGDIKKVIYEVKESESVVRVTFAKAPDFVARAKVGEVLITVLNTASEFFATDFAKGGIFRIEIAPDLSGVRIVVKVREGYGGDLMPSGNDLVLRFSPERGMAKGTGSTLPP